MNCQAIKFLSFTLASSIWCNEAPLFNIGKAHLVPLLGELIRVMDEEGSAMDLNESANSKVVQPIAQLAVNILSCLGGCWALQSKDKTFHTELAAFLAYSRICTDQHPSNANKLQCVTFRGCNVH